MANWITHCIVADRLLEAFPKLDACSLCIGSIAPDCNVENETWTAFDPPREVTHFMTGDSKLTADSEGFYKKYLYGGRIESDEQQAYLIGYYAHLVTDAACQRFIRDECRVQESFERIKALPVLAARIEGLPEDFDTLKQVFGKLVVWGDFAAYEQAYILGHEDSLYNRVLRKTRRFHDWLGILPEGAIERKIPLMAYEVTGIQPAYGVFFSTEEIDDFIEETTERILSKIRDNQ